MSSLAVKRESTSGRGATPNAINAITSDTNVHDSRLLKPSRISE